MELELKKESMDCYEMAADFTAAQEESTEMIVPDNCPDISRIVATEGNVFLRSAEARDGKAELSGAVKVSILYIPEKSASVQALEVSLPFLMIEECPRECSILRPAVFAEELTARTLNPRKVQVQCRLSASIVGYRWVTLPYTLGFTAEKRCCVESLLRQETVSAVTALAEKDFTYEDTLALPQNRGAAAAILLSRQHSQISEAKAIGKKIVVKGNCFAEFLLKYENGRCETASFDLPFSQIAEVEAPQEAKVQAALQLTGMEARLSPTEEGGSEISLSLFCKLQLTVTERRELTLLTDLYSTAYDMETERQELSFLDAEEPQVRRQVWQDTLEVGLSPESILFVSASCGRVTPGVDETEAPELRAPLRLRVLYLAEDGRVLSAERNGEVSLPFRGAGEGLRCRARCAEEISAAITAEGIAVRVPVDFRLESRRVRKVGYVSCVRYEEEKLKDLSAMPSLVLRRKEEGETLWSLAKRHNAAVADILAANGCATEEELPGDRIILIPKRRG
ncbi:MAG: SPOCS domain-containing protein [Oscillospiraceae bacterium]